MRSVAYGESDVIATLFTASEGKISAMVRGGRKSSKRVGGALEPFHTIEVSLDDRGGNLATLKEARLLRVRAGIVGSLEALDAAGTALRWARHVCPPRIPEPAAWATMNDLLDTLDRREAPPRASLAVSALRLLADVGYGLELDRCVACGKLCPEGRAGFIDTLRGGLVCQGCGGARERIGAGLRALAQAAQRGEQPALSRSQVADLLALVDRAMSAHAEFQAPR